MEMNESVKKSYWQEMGRWVGFEETYDVEAGRWGPVPHLLPHLQEPGADTQDNEHRVRMPEVIMRSNLSSDLLSVDCKTVCRST